MIALTPTVEDRPDFVHGVNALVLACCPIH